VFLNCSNGELSSAVCGRIAELEYLRACDFTDCPALAECFSKEAQDKNITAIIQAYRAGTLEVEVGKSSCWRSGAQISPLAPRSMEEISEIAVKNGAREGLFWLEEPEPQLAMPFVSFPASGRNMMHNLIISVRLQGQVEHVDLSFLDDTGSSIICIFTHDVTSLRALGDLQST